MVLLDVMPARSNGASAEAVASPRVAIVILNWMRTVDTLACLQSLRGVDYPALDVVVVDNGSPNDGAAAIRERFPEVTVIENGRNLGFAAGNNVGIAHAVQSGADYVLLLNDDTEVAPDFLRVLIDVGTRDSRIGILGPKICYFGRPNVIWSAGGAVDRYGEPRHLGVDQPDDQGAQDVQDADYVTGCALLVKREVIEQLGALDERFFIYFEETEWCARARRAGFRVVYVPQARVWHKIEGADRGYSRRYLYLMARNRLLYLQCSGASPWVIARAALDLARTATSWMVRPQHRDKRSLSTALLHGVWHFASGRFGPPPATP